MNKFILNVLLLFSIFCINNLYANDYFNVLPFGVTIPQAKTLLIERGFIINNEDSYVNDDLVRYIITTTGSFQGEGCTIGYQFYNGLFKLGTYSFRATQYRSLENIMNNLMERLTIEFKKAPTLKVLYGEMYYSWEINSKLEVSLFNFPNIIEIIYDYNL